MTSRLRRIHQYIWLMIAIIIPVMILFSTEDLALLSPKQSQISHLENLEGDTLSSAENEILIASVLKTKKMQWLALRLKTTISRPSSVVYLLKENGEKGEAIGQLGASDHYEFRLKTPPKGIIIYDDIKDMVITKLEF